MSKVEKPATELLQAYADRTGQKDGALSMQFSGSREKVSRSARSPHDFSDMSMN